MRIELLNPDYIHQFWPIIEPLLARGMEHAKGEMTIDQMKVFITIKTYHVLLMIDDSGAVIAVVIYKFVDNPNDRAFFIVNIAGKINRECVDQMFELAKSQGATSVRGTARESVARLWKMKFGFETIYRVVERKL